MAGQQGAGKKHDFLCGMAERAGTKAKELPWRVSEESGIQGREKGLAATEMGRVGVK
jgi:hypothetical protein